MSNVREVAAARWTVSALVCATVACGGSPAEPGAGPHSATASQQVAPSTAPSTSAETVVARAELVSEPSWAGQVSEARVLAPALARLIEPCFDGGPLPLDVHVGVPVGADGTLGEARLDPPARDEALLTCVRNAVAAARGMSSGDPFGGDLRFQLHVTAANAPRAPFTFPERPEQLCARDRDCVLIVGGCATPEAVPERLVSERSRANALRLAAAECRGGDPVVPVRAVCERHVCATTESDHPDWRTCRSDAECVNVPRHCGGWDVVARRAEVEARAAFAAETPGCTTESDPDDTHQAECRYGFCAYEWRSPTPQSE